MQLVLRWLVSAATLMLVAYLVPGIMVDSVYAALVAALILGLINALIRPLLIVLTLPINILTLGLFTFVINAAMFLLASTIVKGFYVSGFWAALWGAIIMWLVGWAVSSLIKSSNSTNS